MGRNRTEGVEDQRREGRPKTIRRPLVGCREGNGAYALEASICVPRGGREERACEAPGPRGEGAGRHEHENEKVPWGVPPRCTE